MQQHRLRLDLSLSGKPIPAPNDLRQFGGYYAYGNTLGGGMVDSFNVRQFLNDPKNQVIIDDFKTYLSMYTTESEFVQVVGSNEKLSEIFNEFYETTVIQSLPTSSDVISENLTDSVNFQHVTTDMEWNGISNQNGLDNIPMSIDAGERTNLSTTISTQIARGIDYHIPVFIQRVCKENSKDQYNGCPSMFNQLLDPDLFDAPQTVIEGAEGRIDGSITISNGDGTTFVSNETLMVDFPSMADQVITACYAADCVDNRYCDFLRSGKLLVEQAGEDSVRSVMGETTNEVTDRIAVSAMVGELSANGYPVVEQIYDCLFGSTVIDPHRSR